MLSYKKLRVSRSSTSKLSVLKRRTGLTPNLICRIALCFSLESSGLPALDFDEEGSEFNRYTLTGDWDLLFVALLIERLHKDGLDISQDGLLYLKAHLNRGVSMVHSRVKDLPDFLKLYSESKGDM